MRDIPAATVADRVRKMVLKANTILGPDVEQAFQAALAEEENPSAKEVLSQLLENAALARDTKLALCQDTGTIICYADLPAWCDEFTFEKAYERAVVQATKKGYLRQNSVNSLTGKNSGTNLGPGSPAFHLHQTRKKSLTVRMILKGGGCENVGAQYSLPDTRLGAGRDLEGVRTCVLDAVQQAQGKGCGPGILGVCIGGDRGSGYLASKEEFFRTLDDTNADPKLAKLEKQIVREANQLGIGPMGFGGKTTLLGCKITHRNRVPASFFVSVSYMCWAYRRDGFQLSESGKVTRWLYS